MSRSLAAAIIIPAVLLASTAVRASDECPPGDYLLMEVTNFWLDDKSRLAFAMTMNKEQFDKAKAHAKAGAKFPIEGVPIDAYADVGKANEAAKREAQSRSYTLDTSQSIALLTHTVSQAGKEAYLACEQNAANNPGLRLRVLKENGNLITVGVKFKPGDTMGSLTSPRSETSP
jgi:hypothetical protein